VHPRCRISASAEMSQGRLRTLRRVDYFPSKKNLIDLTSSQLNHSWEDNDDIFYERDNEVEDEQLDEIPDELDYVKNNRSDLPPGGGLPPGSEWYHDRLRKVERVDYSPNKRQNIIECIDLISPAQKRQRNID
jgi:hypothetical protein